MLIAKNKIEDSIFHEDEIKECATKLLSEINDIEPIDGYKYLSISNIDSSFVDFTGEYFCNCCSDQESYDYYFDIELLHDEKSRNLFLNELRNKVKAKQKKESERAEKIAQENEAKEKVLYLKLKLKFENSGEQL
jgi:hypothetical protein